MARLSGGMCRGELCGAVEEPEGARAGEHGHDDGAALGAALALGPAQGEGAGAEGAGGPGAGQAHCEDVELGGSGLGG